jgi:cytochrome b561
MVVPELGYTRSARILHWLTAVLVLAAIPAGIAMVNVGAGPLQNFLFDFHRSLGVTLIPMIWLRLIWRLAHRPPPLPGTIPPLQAWAAHAVHVALYALLIIQPLIGWVGTSAFRAPIDVWWLFELPPIWPEDRAFSDQVLFVHAVTGLAIACLLAAHIGAALHHHFIRKDRILMRMVSG